MSTIVMWLKKTGLVVTVLALSLGIFPLTNAFALGAAEPITPATPTPPTYDRLGRAWAKEQTIYTELGPFFDNSDRIISRIQDLINKAASNGKDTAALQAALDAFAKAVKQADPVYQSIGGIITTHPGFDENGEVTDRVLAAETVLDVRNKFMAIRQLLLDPRQALRDAIKAFREGNKPAPTSTPTQSSG
jgi:hypothetical protein